MDVKKNTLTRLTALWALSESGLGGFMHALKIPFTGFFLGGFAIVIITLIAHYSTSRLRDILQATLLVMLVKAAASPHSPPMAYIAVGFQGLTGAVFFSIVKYYRLAAMLFGFIALLESAVQKFLVMTLIFGKSIWEALDLFFKGILKDLSLPGDFSFSFWLIITYAGVYSLWGMTVGFWASSLPDHLEDRSHDVLRQVSQLEYQDISPALVKKKKRNRKLVGAFFILLFIAGVFLMMGTGSKALYAITRTVAALLLLFYFINPLVKWGINRWLSRQKEERQQHLTAVMDALPELRNNITPAYQLARKQHKGLAVYKHFVVYLIMLTLYYKSPVAA